MAPFICRGWGVWQGPGCRSTTPQLVKRFLSFLRMAGQESSAGKIITCTHAAHLLKHSRVRREKRQRCFAPRDRKFRMWRFLKAKSSRPGLNNPSKKKTFKTTDEWRWGATVKSARKTTLLQIAKISEQSEETGRAARKQELISQQNTSCTRCRPVISLLPLLIYFLTSAARPLQPKLNPREGRGGGGQRGRKQEMREEGGEVVLTLSSILLHIVIIFIFCPPSIMQGY